MEKRILITGGAGFIGSKLALSLVERGYHVRILDNLSMQIHGEDPLQSKLYQSIKNKTEFIKGDVRQRKDWLEALEGQEMVVHLAAETGTGQSMYEIEKYCSVNINGTAIMLDLITNNKELRVKKIVVASSRAIYGEGKYQNSEGEIEYPNPRNVEDLRNGEFEIKCPYTGKNLQLLPTDEDSKIHPSSIYGITKYNQEQMVLTIGKALDIPVVALRYQNVYGPGQSLTNPYTGILSIFSTLIKNGEDLNIFEDGKESRDFVYIDDVVNATILALEKKEANHKVYNVGSGVPINVLTVAQKLREKYKTKSAIRVTGNYRLGDIRHNYADLSRIKKELGYEPEVDFESGISRFVDWVNSEKVKKSRYKESLVEMETKGLYKS
jgi:dTDP-L-rhamnose 4-epimerase